MAFKCYFVEFFFVIALILWNFIAVSEAARKNPTQKNYEEVLLIIVDPLGKGDYTKIQEAINAVPSNNKEVVFISVKPGVYKEKIVVPVDKPFITISGSNPHDTIITWDDSGNIFESPTFAILANDFVARSLTIQVNY